MDIIWSCSSARKTTKQKY